MNHWHLPITPHPGKQNIFSWMQALLEKNNFKNFAYAINSNKDYKTLQCTEQPWRYGMHTCT